MFEATLVVLSFLAKFNCYPEAYIVPSNATFFLDGVVYIHPDMYKDHVLVHELVHDCQWRKHGNAKTYNEWVMRERQAMHLESVFLEQQK